jgi:hypothetical protein
MTGTTAAIATMEAKNGMPLTEADWSTIYAVVTAGDMAELTEQQRTTYYRLFCESLGLNPVTQPFGYFKQNNKLTLYAKKDATEQLRAKRKISLRILDQQEAGGLYIVTISAETQDGRIDTDVGAVPLPVGGEPRANAIMKAFTKAKRRVTLSICGLGISDESELSSIPGAMIVNPDTGEVREAEEDAAPAQTLRARTVATEPEKTPMAAPGESASPQQRRFLMTMIAKQDKWEEADAYRAVAVFYPHAKNPEGKYSIKALSTAEIQGLVDFVERHPEGFDQEKYAKMFDRWEIIQAEAEAAKRAKGYDAEA